MTGRYLYMPEALWPAGQADPYDMRVCRQADPFDKIGQTDNTLLRSTCSITHFCTEYGGCAATARFA